MNPNKWNVVLILLIAALFNSCISTRYIPEDQYLLGNVNVRIDDQTINKDELSSYLRQKENLKILGFVKFHLAIYNLSSKDKPEGILKRIGEAPVIFDETLHEKSKQQFIQYLKNKGYYNAVVDDRIEYKRHKALVDFNIKTNEPYRIDQLSYTIKDDRIAAIVADNVGKSLLKTNNIFDVDVLDQERERLTLILKNEGFYNFYSDYIHFSVDTLFKNKMADIDMIIERPSVSGSNLQPVHKRYIVDHYSVFIGDQRKGGTSSDSTAYSDSLIGSTIDFHFNEKLDLKRSLISRLLYPKVGQFYSKSNEEKSYNNLYEIRQFKYVNMQFHEVPNKGDSLTGHLIGDVFLPMQVRQNYAFELEGTTSGNVGIGGNLSYNHKNLIHGAEIFSLSFKGAREWQIMTSNVPYNKLDLTGEAKIVVPSYSLSWFRDLFGFYSIPRIQLGVSYNYSETSKFRRTIANVSHAYMWRSNVNTSHTLNPIDLNIVRVFKLNEDFLNSIKDLYIRSSFTDHVVTATNYTFVYSRRATEIKPDYHYLRYSVESAGNILGGVSKLFGRKTYQPDGTQSPYYQFIGSRFSQYLKGDFEYRYGYRIDKINAVAMRGFLGVGLPYGNNKVLPIEKQYYTGGANGIRAWQVRSLGPGTYKGSYQSGDIKLEANVEYRFKMISAFEGALFMDAGNIWGISARNDNREGAVFHFNSFTRQIAVGSGFGIRFATTYFIARLDLGVKLRDPSLPVGQRWIPAYRGFMRDDLNLNIGIGYPF